MRGPDGMNGVPGPPGNVGPTMMVRKPTNYALLFDMFIADIFIYLSFVIIKCF